MIKDAEKRIAAQLAKAMVPGNSSSSDFVPSVFLHQIHYLAIRCHVREQLDALADLRVSLG